MRARIYRRLRKQRIAELESKIVQLTATNLLLDMKIDMLNTQYEDLKFKLSKCDKSNCIHFH